MVEMFYVEENKELIHDQEQIDKWKELVQNLGLEGQADLSREGRNPIPFMNMDTITERVYSVLCPMKVEIEKYGKTAIPVQVLGAVALCKKERYFEKIQIWYDDKSPDPVCVGLLGTEKFLIGKWGEEALEFSVLKERAKKLKRERDLIGYRNTLRHYQGYIENIDAEIESHFG